MRMPFAAIVGLLLAAPLLAGPQEPPPPFPGAPGLPMFRSAAQEFKELIPTLIEALKDADPEVRQHSALALAHLGRDAMAPLTEALKDSNKERRAAAAYGLGQMGFQARESIPALLKIMKDEDTAVRRSVSLAINRIVAAEGHPFPGFAPGMRGFGGAPALPAFPGAPATVAPPLPVPDPTPKPPEKKDEGKKDG